MQVGKIENFKPWYEKGRLGEMPKVITYGGDTKIGAYKFADRKKVCLCVEKGNEITIYGTFNSEYSANNFMDELGRFIGAQFDHQTEKGG